MRGWLLALVVVTGASCASITPAQPRFIGVFDQRNSFCRIQVIKDTRSAACFVAFKCGHHPVTVLPAEPEVCVP